jgi:hypothetical protein
MNVSVLLEQLNDNAYRATSFSPVPLVAEATTRKQAVDRIREMVRDKLSKGEAIQVEVLGKAEIVDPWRAMIGIWKDNPDAADVVENMREYRKEVDAENGAFPLLHLAPASPVPRSGKT